MVEFIFYLRTARQVVCQNYFTVCLIRALEAAGVEFIDENGGGPGVRHKGKISRSAS